MQNTAVIIFANSAATECLYRKLLPNQDDNLKLFEQLNKRIAAVVKKTGVPHFVFDELIQVGADYGEGIANAMAMVYGKGFENVIIVWNDCPKLELQHLERAMAGLATVPLVIGPDHWGGVYLLGVSKRIFSRAKFASLYWQTNILAVSLMHYKVPNLVLPKLRALNSRHSVRVMLLGAFFERLAVSAPIFNLVRFFRSKIRLIFIKLHIGQASISR